ncbi:MAG: hypothetical protein EOP53_24810 [Sphingobacteriales bacterium]|nr:MAG: hypothetical protein EOP53_24810 [Sphingobacteriales bacterium]
MSTTFETHKALLDQASQAVIDRNFFAAYPEHPKAYAEDGMAKGAEWFNNQLNNPFGELLQTGEIGFKGTESSPYTQELLNISYPVFETETLIQKAKATQRTWKNATPETRAAVLIESLDRIKKRFFDIAYATMHTSGQSFMMSFQASGPHANDRALEAIVLGYQELKRFPANADWEKPMGKISVKVKKTWKLIDSSLACL